MGLHARLCAKWLYANLNDKVPISDVILLH